jgi:hypothetical protein
MKCTAHNEEANGICAYCGRALCSHCSRSPAQLRNACSDACATALGRADRAVELIIQKTVQGAKAGALSCYISGVLFVLTGIAAAIFMSRDTFLIVFPAALGIGLIISGVAFSKVARQHAAEPQA